MNLEFVKYFFTYLIKAKDRQHLLLLSIVGLALSSFALVVLQSTMGGLQQKLIGRSKSILGHGLIQLNQESQREGEKLHQLRSYLKTNQIPFSEEYELEVLLKNQSFLTPVVVHGFNESTELPTKIYDATTDGPLESGDAILPEELNYKIRGGPYSQYQILSPVHTDGLLMDIPRLGTISLKKLVNFDVPELDSFHIWVKLSTIQNLIRERSINRLRFYKSLSDDQFHMLKDFGKIILWEDWNQALVYALNLEATIMVFLFGAMSLLISFCIVTGLLIFFNKVRLDLSSFWILGLSKKAVFQSTTLFLYLMNSVAILVGMILGIGVLLCLEKFGQEFLPPVFIDRKIPVFYSAKTFFISFIIPFSISSIFIFFALKKFRQEKNFLKNIRSLGN